MTRQEIRRAHAEAKEAMANAYREAKEALVAELEAAGVGGTPATQMVVHLCRAYQAWRHVADDLGNHARAPAHVHWLAHHNLITQIIGDELPVEEVEAAQRVATS